MCDHQPPKIFFLEYNEQDLCPITFVQQAGAIRLVLLKCRWGSKKADHETKPLAKQFEIKASEHSARIFNTPHTSTIAEDIRFNFMLYWSIRAHLWLTLPRYLAKAWLNAE